ncbi:MAG: cation transporter [Bacteroidota bacterium]
MKKILVFVSLIIVSFTTILHAQDSTSSFKVFGNCESCKSRIEKAAKAAGATKAEWSEETKLIAVSFDAAKTSSDKIQQKIAAVGHDTEKYKSLENTYNKLPGCCKYERESGTEKQ